MQVRWLRTALRDLEQVTDYIALDSPDADERLEKRIAQAVQTTGAHPNIGRPGRVAGTRELVVAGTPYIVPYRVQKDVVEILRVFHAARKWPESF
ncbi:MAG: type II toxin-antitoxin system RelE/ParE family toxin [Acidobacteriaceae bacterium]